MYRFLHLIWIVIVRCRLWCSIYDGISESVGGFGNFVIVQWDCVLLLISESPIRENLQNLDSLSRQKVENMIVVLCCFSITSIYLLDFQAKS